MSLGGYGICFPCIYADLGLGLGLGLDLKYFRFRFRSQAPFQNYPGPRNWKETWRKKSWQQAEVIIYC